MSDSAGTTPAGQLADGQQLIGAFLTALGLNATHTQQYTTLLAARGVENVAQLESVPEEELAAMGVMRGHARRIVTEIQRRRNLAITPPAAFGLERHGTILDPSPLTTPVSPAAARRFPTSASTASLSDQGAAAPAATATAGHSQRQQQHLHDDANAAAPASASERGCVLMPQDFTCFICMEFVVSPRTIVCGHTFCAHCIVNWADVREDASCPLCRASMKHPSTGRVVIPPLNKMLDDVSQRAFPARYRHAAARVEASQRIMRELRKLQLFVRNPSTAMLLKIMGSGSGAAVLSRHIEEAMLRVPRIEFCPPRVDARATALACESGPTRIDGLEFNITAPGIQAAVLNYLDFRPGDTFLDVGTGSGVIAAWGSLLAGPTGRVLAIDCDADACAYARRNIAIQARRARDATPPLNPPRGNHSASWWIHPGCTLTGTATPIPPTRPKANPPPSSSSQANRSSSSGTPPPEASAASAASSAAAAAAASMVDPDDHAIHVRITGMWETDAGTQVDAIVISGKRARRHARCRGLMIIQPKEGTPAVHGTAKSVSSGLKPVRSRSPQHSPQAHARPGARAVAVSVRAADPAAALAAAQDAAATSAANDAANAEFKAVKDQRKAALHLTEVQVFGDNPRSLYHFTSEGSVDAKDDPAIAAEPLHYVLRLSLNSAVRGGIADLNTVDGFVGYKTPSDKMMKIADVAMTMDESTQTRIRWWASRPPTASPQSDDASAAALCWPPTAACLENVFVAHLNVFALLDAVSEDPTTTSDAVRDALGLDRLCSVSEYSGIFDKIFIGAEPNDRIEFARLIRLLKDGGKLVMPFENELMCITRERDQLLCEPKMSVSFGRLIAQRVVDHDDEVRSTPTNRLQHAMEEAHEKPFKQIAKLCAPVPAVAAAPVSSSAASPASRASPVGAPGFPGLAHHQPSHSPAVYYSKCCAAPVADGSRELKDLHRVIGDKLSLLEGTVHVFASRPSTNPTSTTGDAAAAPLHRQSPQLLIRVASDLHTVHLTGLDADAVIVKCPCNKPLGVRIVTPVRHCPSGEDWVGFDLLCEAYVTSTKPRIEQPTQAPHSTLSSRNAAAPAAPSRHRGADDITCIRCNSVVAHKQAVIRQTIDWMDLPSQAGAAVSSVPARPHNLVSACLLNDVCLERLTIGPVHQLAPNPAIQRIPACAYSHVHCAHCRSTLGCHIVAPAYACDTVTAAPYVGRYIMLLSRLHGMHQAQRLDALQRVFHAIMLGGNVNETPGARLSSSDLMQLFSAGSSDDDNADGDSPPRNDDAAAPAVGSAATPASAGRAAGGVDASSMLPAPVLAPQSRPSQTTTPSAEDDADAVPRSRQDTAEGASLTEPLLPADGYNTFGAELEDDDDDDEEDDDEDDDGAA